MSERPAPGENPSGPAPQAAMPPLPRETVDAMGNIRNCVLAMYIFAFLRLIIDSDFFLGALFEFAVAAVGTSLLRYEPTMAHIISRIDCHPPPECKIEKFGVGVHMLEIFVCLCVVGACTDVRHTWYMRGANASSLEIFSPVLVYLDAFLYFCACVLGLQLRCAGWRSIEGLNYAEISIGNSQLQHAASASDSEEEIMRRAMQASQEEAAPPAAGVDLAAATGVDLAAATGSTAREDADMAQALELSRKEAEDAAKRQAEEVRRKRSEQFRAQQGRW